jgi:hypothetical protein
MAKARDKEEQYAGWEKSLCAACCKYSHVVNSDYKIGSIIVMILRQVQLEFFL